MKIMINDVIGPRCIIKEDGQKIHDAILAPLKNGEKVELDFENVKQMASPFFNFAIGKLLEAISLEQYHKLVKVININETGEMIIERVLENSKSYYTDVNFKQIVDDILSSQAQDN